MMHNIIAPRYAQSIVPRYAPNVHSGFQIGAMKTAEEVRRERLAQLRAEAGSLVALNEKLGLTSRDATLSQILNQAKNSRTGTPKTMGSKMARELETACGKEYGWMDTDPALAGGGVSEDLSELAHLVDQLPPKQRAWVVMTLREAVSLARETITDAAETHPPSGREPPIERRRKATG